VKTTTFGLLVGVNVKEAEESSRPKKQLPSSFVAEGSKL
jgi:hypothetical protein